VKNLAICLLCITGTALSAAKGVLFERQWGTDISIRVNEHGDSIGLCAAFADSSSIYLYDCASGRIIRYNHTGERVSAIAIQSIGRTTWAGDDFVIIGNEAHFLNTIDRRIEIFDMLTGRHTAQIPYTAAALSGEQSRIARTINRIFFDKHITFLGNDRVLFRFNRATSKQAQGTPVLRAGYGKRIVAIEKGKPVTVAANDRSALRKTSGTKGYYPMSGKRHIVVDGILYVVCTGAKGFRIERLK
jgi:hypothetical protein